MFPLSSFNGPKARLHGAGYVFDEDEVAELVEPMRGQVQLMLGEVLDGRPAPCARSLVRPWAREALNLEHGT
jgi:hypothetical protein